MECPACTTQFQEGTVRCPECAFQIEATCPDCQISTAGSKCPECGVSLPRPNIPFQWTLVFLLLLTLLYVIFAFDYKQPYEPRNQFGTVLWGLSEVWESGRISGEGISLLTWLMLPVWSFAALALLTSQVKNTLALRTIFAINAVGVGILTVTPVTAGIFSAFWLLLCLVLLRVAHNGWSFLSIDEPFQILARYWWAPAAFLLATSACAAFLLPFVQSVGWLGSGATTGWSIIADVGSERSGTWLWLVLLIVSIIGAVLVVVVPDARRQLCWAVGNGLLLLSVAVLVAVLSDKDRGEFIGVAPSVVIFSSVCLRLLGFLRGKETQEPAPWIRAVVPLVTFLLLAGTIYGNERYLAGIGAIDRARERRRNPDLYSYSIEEVFADFKRRKWRVKVRIERSGYSTWFLTTRVTHTPLGLGAGRR